MNKNTKRLMAVFRRKLTKLIDLENRHCGQEDAVNKAMDCRFDLERWLEGEIFQVETRSFNDGAYQKRSGPL